MPVYVSECFGPRTDQTDHDLSINLSAYLVKII